MAVKKTYQTEPVWSIGIKRLDGDTLCNCIGSLFVLGPTVVVKQHNDLGFRDISFEKSQLIKLSLLKSLGQSVWIKNGFEKEQYKI